MRGRACIAAFASFLVVASACTSSGDQELDSSVADGATRDAGPVHADGVDLLFVIGNTSGATLYQQQLRQQVPRLITTLVTGRRDAALGGPFTPPRSLHIGVVSTTMGLGPVTSLPGCPPGFGDDGVLLTRSLFPVAGCPTTDYAPNYPHGVFAFEQSEVSTVAQYAMDVSCIEALGTGGCGIQFSLEAALKALAPAPDASGRSSVDWTAPGYVPPIFWGNTYGHGADPATNGGLVRRDSVLAIVMLTDHFDLSTESYGPMWPAVLFPVQRYVDGLIGLRRNPSALVLEAIVGMPNELSPPDGTVTSVALIDEIASDPRMFPGVDPTSGHLSYVCQTTGGIQMALPGYRIVQVAQGLAHLGARVGVHSICESDFAPAIDELVANIAPSFQ